MSNTFLNFSHLNIGSVFTGFDLFSEYVLDNSLDIVGISETWLKPSFPNYGINIHDYNLVRKDRATRGGGVSFYIKKDIKFKLLECPDLAHSPLESLWISTRICGKKFCLGTLYRPPSTDFSSFLEHLENILVTFIPEFDHILFGGDFNVNLLDEKNANVGKLSNLLEKYGLHQLITQPTHKVGNSKTLIDLLVTSDLALINNTLVTELEQVSKHCIVQCDLKVKCNKQLPKFITYRNFSEFNYDAFVGDLNSVNWNYIYSLHSVDEMLKFWNNSLLTIFDIHAPMITIRVTKKPAPWLTPNLKFMMKLKKKAFNKYKRLKTDASYSEYKELRNFVNKSVRAEKKAFLQFKFKADPKTFWKTLNYLNITEGNNNTVDINPHLYNNFLINTLPQSSNSSDPDLILNKYDGTFMHLESEFNFKSVTTSQIENIIYKIKTQARGSDNINIKMLLLVIPQLSEYITFIINTCLITGVFPTIWKDSHIIPLAKKNNPEVLSDYRPISILSTLSKVLEAIVREQLNMHLNKNNILPSTQSGFRELHSTTTTLLHVADDIFRANDNGYNTCLILIDFSKAFDTLDHSILLKKLNYFGAGNNVMKFFKSYLSNRRQCVRIGNSVSAFNSVNKGVPQGSILGPTLFSIYTADFYSYLNHCKIHQYADDTQLYFSFCSEESILAANYINGDLKTMVNVANVHRLVLNGKKTELLIFGKNKLNLMEDVEFIIKIDDQVLKPSSQCRNLGLILDNSLRFSAHVTRLVQTSYNKLKILYMHKDYLNTDTKLLLCDSLVLSHLAYCDVIYWPALTSKDKNTLQKIQNSCIRYSFKLRKYDHISSAYSLTKWLKLEERFIYHMSCLIFKIRDSHTPSYLFEKLIKGSDVHQVPTRNRDMYTVPKHATSQFERCFTYNATKIFNDIPVSIKSATSLYTFRRQIRDWITSKQ